MLTLLGPMLADLLLRGASRWCPASPPTNTSHCARRSCHPTSTRCTRHWPSAAGPGSLSRRIRLSTPIDTISGPPAPLSLVFLPREFQIAGDTFDDTFRLIGPSLGSRSHSPDWAPPADGAPVLFISLGTTFNDRPDFFTTCTHAFAGSQWHVVMAVGDRVSSSTIGEIPANFKVRRTFRSPPCSVTPVCSSRTPG